MNKITKISWLVIASCLLLGAQQGVQMVIMAGPTGAAPLNPCLISAWPVNEGSGTTLHDTSGGTNTATISGSTNWTTASGFPGSVNNWPGGSSATATSTTLTNFTGTTAFSVSVWTVGSSSTGTFIGDLATGSNFKGWELGTNLYGGSQNYLQFFLINNYPTNAINVHGTTNITAGSVWYLVATYDGSQTAAGVKLYVNGVLDTPAVLINTLSLTSASGLAARMNNRNDGTLAENSAFGYVEVYNCVLTSGQITTYNAAGPGIY